ncbi:hypothetical protein LTS18_006930, partial [Coniosporium uncinatum]
ASFLSIFAPAPAPRPSTRGNRNVHEQAPGPARVPSPAGSVASSSRVVEPVIAKARSASSTSRRRPRSSASIFATLLRPATPRSIRAARTPKPPPLPAVPEETRECLTCCDDVVISKSAELECGHVMCNDCLVRIFTLSTTDPEHMPPKCCTETRIPLSHVEKIFDSKFKHLWMKKYAEFATKDRMYCPRKGCGEWIKPRYQELDRSVGRRHGTCRKCDTKVCKNCNMKWHGTKECRNDPETKKLLDTAREEGWQRCYNCKAVVQLSEGCNHMKCRCTAEFCMICGERWKTCDCPWFNTPQEDQVRMPNFHRAFDILNDLAGPAAAAVARNRGMGYQHAPRAPPANFQDELEQRRRQEAEDEQLARRLAAADLNDNNPLANFFVGWGQVPPVMDVAMRTFGRHAGVEDLLGNHNDPIRQLLGGVLVAANQRGGVNRRAVRRRTYRVNQPVRSAAGSVRAASPVPALPPRRRAQPNAVGPDIGQQDIGDFARGLDGAPPASAMAGLAADGSRTGQQRVGRWLNHVERGEEWVDEA